MGRGEFGATCVDRFAHAAYCEYAAHFGYAAYYEYTAHFKYAARLCYATYLGCMARLRCATRLGCMTRLRCATHLGCVYRFLEHLVKNERFKRHYAVFWAPLVKNQSFICPNNRIMANLSYTLIGSVGLLVKNEHFEMLSTVETFVLDHGTLKNCKKVLAKTKSVK